MKLSGEFKEESGQTGSRSGSIMEDGGGDGGLRSELNEKLLGERWESGASSVGDLSAEGVALAPLFSSDLRPEGLGPPGEGSTFSVQPVISD